MADRGDPKNAIYEGNLCFQLWEDDFWCYSYRYDLSSKNAGMLSYRRTCICLVWNVLVSLRVYVRNKWFSRSVGIKLFVSSHAKKPPVRNSFPPQMSQNSNNMHFLVTVILTLLWNALLGLLNAGVAVVNVNVDICLHVTQINSQGTAMHDKINVHNNKH